MKTRILHIVLSLETGGLENGIVNLCNYSNKDEFDIDVLCLRNKGELADRIIQENCSVYFDEDHNPSILNAIAKIYRHCKTHSYHVIHTHGFSTMLAGYVAAKLTRTPVIINGEHGTFYSDSWKKRTIQKWLFSKVDLNLSVSSVLKHSIIKAFNIRKDNFLPILNGVDTEKFKRTNENSSLRHELQIDNSTTVIGYVGRLVPGKDVTSLVKAFSLVKQQFDNTHLLIIGDGPEHGPIFELISQLNMQGSITMLGRRDDIPRCLNSMDAFCLPSLSEGLSNTILEAMATALPTVACNVGGNPEIVIEGKTGLLVPPQDPKALASALGHLVSDQQKLANMAKSTREFIENQHSIEHMVFQYQGTYLKLLSNKSIQKNSGLLINSP